MVKRNKILKLDIKKDSNNCTNCIISKPSSKLPNKFSRRPHQRRLEVITENFLREYNKTNKNKPLNYKPIKEGIEVRAGNWFSTHYFSITTNLQVYNKNKSLEKLYPNVPILLIDALKDYM